MALFFLEENGDQEGVDSLQMRQFCYYALFGSFWLKCKEFVGIMLIMLFSTYYPKQIQVLKMDSEWLLDRSCYLVGGVCAGCILNS